jgi:hypothetical protein
VLLPVQAPLTPPGEHGLLRKDVFYDGFTSEDITRRSATEVNGPEYTYAQSIAIISGWYKKILVRWMVLYTYFKSACIYLTTSSYIIK